MSRPTRTKPLSQLERIEQLEKASENVAMAVRVSQMLLQQILPQFQAIQQKLGQTDILVNDLSYKLDVLATTLGVDEKALENKVVALKLSDWASSSAKDDEAKGLVVVDVVSSAEDIVIITSQSSDESKMASIFRSKIVLAETQNPEMIEKLMNQSVGTKVSVQIGDVVHIIELLGVRSKG